MWSISKQKYKTVNPKKKKNQDKVGKCKGGKTYCNVSLKLKLHTWKTTYVRVIKQLQKAVNHSDVRDGYDEKGLASLVIGDVILLRKANKQQSKRSEIAKCLS